MLSHGNLTSAVSVYDVWGKPARAERNAIERVICVLPLFHIYALTVVLLSSIRRGNLISLHQRFDVEAVMRDIEVKRATAFPGVPTMWIAIAALPDLDKRDLSSLVVAAAPAARRCRSRSHRILERRVGMKLKSGWGMTETCSPGTAHPKEGPDKPGSIGLMLPGIEMDVVSLEDPTKLMPVGEAGEIRIRGPNVTKGYWNRPKETAEAFVGDRFLTGDIGYMDADGYFYLVDRKKDMIISGGFNVYPQMIEQAIYTHPSVQEVIVIGIPDDYRGEAAKAFIKLRDGAKPFTLDELRAFLTGKLGKHEIPAAVDFVDELPRTPVGKLSRHELRMQQSPAAGRHQTTSRIRRSFLKLRRRPCERRDPYAAALVWGTLGRRLCQSLTPVVMGPCFQGRREIKSSRYQRVLIRSQEDPMDLAFSKEEIAFREEVRAFFRDNVPPETRRKMVEGRHLSKDEMVAWWRILNKKGWGCSHWPKEYGGTGWTSVQHYIFNEELQMHPAPAPLAFGVSMVGPVIYTFGNEKQKKQYLPRIANVDDWWCQGFSEPGSGSDLASLKTKAERKGDKYIINGQKTWTTLAQHADMIFCLCRTDTNAKKQMGISFIVFDMKSKGVTVRPIETIDGGREVNEVFFDDVEVPVENLIGEENKGWDYAKFLLGNERTGIARVGVSKERLRRIKDLASKVEQNGKPVIEDQGFREKLAACEIELKALELTQLRVVADEGKHGKGKPNPASSVLKIKGSEIQQTTTELLMEVIGPFAAPYDVHGDDGSNETMDWTAQIAPSYFNNRKVSIYGGSNEIQRNIITKAVLGL